MIPRHLPALVALLLCALQVAATEPLLLVHYLPWYASRDISGQWGWHWGMNHFKPDEVRWDGRRQIASQDYPLIGPYDSGDDAVLESQVLLMKYAGLDGVILDWYGTGNLNDHAAIHRNSLKLISWLNKAGLKYALCHEDQGLKSLGQQAAAQQVQRDVDWAAQHLFGNEGYLREQGKPLLLVFGPQLVDWRNIHHQAFVRGLPHLAKAHALQGSFAWPPVSGGRNLKSEQWQAELGRLHREDPQLLACAFPGFRDIYRQAGLHDSYGRIDPRDGETLRESLRLALKSKATMIQIATWNDYGEGTVIEPTHSRGLRDLQALPRCGNPAHLRLPLALLELRRRGASQARLDQAALLLFEGKAEAAEIILDALEKELGQRDDGHGHRLLREVLYREEANPSPAARLRCRLDLHAPSKPGFATLLWFHGGGLTAGERFIPTGLRDQGIAVLAANYRLAPEDDPKTSLADAAAAIAWTLRHIEEFGGDAKRVFVGGHSAGAYLALMCGLDEQWLGAHDLKPKAIAGLIPLSPQVITHFTMRRQQGMPQTQPLIDPLAPLYHVRADAAPIFLATGDRELELMGRYEECAYFWRMMKLNGHKQLEFHEFKGRDHGNMPEPALPLLLEFMQAHSPAKRR